MPGDRRLTFWLALIGAALLTAHAPAQDLFEEFAGPPPEPVVDWREDGHVVPAAFQQPPALDQPVEPARAPARGRSLGSRQRLASVPNMFGDVGMSAGTLFFFDPQERSQGAFNIPGAGGSRRVKIGENNSPIPQDRYFFNYNHFHNVFEFTEVIFSPRSVRQFQEPIDRFTLGVEKVLLDDWSVEVRLPIVAALDVQGQTFAANGGNWGNLAVIVKRLLYADDELALAAGLGLDLPTGSGFESTLGPATLRFENDAVHLLPYLGVVLNPGHGLFFTGYMQIDVAANGNEVLVGASGQRGQPVGKFNEQNLMYFDVAAGCWLHDNPDGEWITGIAAMLEFHHTTSVQDADRLFIQNQLINAAITTPGNRFDVTNMSTGLNFALGEAASLRVAGVFPLGSDFERRFFDSELQIQFNQRF